MARRFEGLKRFGSKAGRLLVSGALACSLTPAIALAETGLQTAEVDIAPQGNVTVQHYDYDNNSGLVAFDKDGNPSGEEVALLSAKDNVYRYRGYAHSDNGSHYKGYSLITEMTTNGDGVLTGIDISSDNSMFTGMWGYKVGSKTMPSVDGYLPDGVNFSVTVGSKSEGEGATTSATYKPVLTDPKYGMSLSKVVFISTNADGTKAKGGAGDKKVESDSVTANSDGSYSAPATEGTEYNLIRFTYQTAYEKVPFDCYYCIGNDPDAEAYCDVVGQTKWGVGINTTNRDGWTGIMATMTLRMLESWGATMKDESLMTENGEIGTIDTVSGATKTSQPFAAALNAAYSAGYIKGVSENVQVTIDKNSTDTSTLPPLTVNKSADDSAYQDVVSVVKNSDGTYTATGTFKPKGGGRLSLDAVTLYDLSGVKLGAQGVKNLSKTLTTEDNKFKSYIKWQQVAPDTTKNGETVTFFTPDSENHIISFGNRTDGEGFQTNVYTATTDRNTGKTTVDTSSTPITVGTASSSKVTTGNAGDSANYIDAKFIKKDDSTIQYQITSKNQAVTHLAMTYTLGHGRITSVYDLENQSKVPDVSAKLAAASASDESSVATARAAYNALPYDVRPFTTGIDALETAEAGLVSAKLLKAQESESAYTAAKDAYKAYGALDAAAQEKVDAAAKTAYDTAVKAHAIASVTLSQASYQYTGSDIKPAVTVKSVAGTTVPASGYAVSYSNNANVGTATVRVTATGAYTGSASATFTIGKAASSIALKAQNLTYTGKTLAYSGEVAKAGSTGDVTYAYYSDAACTKTATPKAAGTYYVKATLAADANYDAATSEAVKLTVAKASQSVSFKSQTVKVKAKKVAKKAQKVAIKKASAKTTVTYKISKYGNAKAKKCIKSIDRKTGKVTVKKGAPRGSYKLTVKASAAASGNYKAASAKKVITVKVK